VRLAAKGQRAPKGGITDVLATAEYLRDELARRSQNRQTRSIIAMTIIITAMTAITTAAVVAPHRFQALAGRLGIEDSDATSGCRSSNP
jgi:hypothetical protein